ncbi:glutaminyl-peptide cyclotransferase [Sorghum bicolor]|uniref:glutaminyl-peptide cyclotransferase n=1 Tax=Sorghum bicolor TaxID=4558 RepID=UPI000B42679B|nr:glutaminyl-peptide cyclotransferase [Sorghum bicolor]|eukprot:XP_002453168.2 glutaminyl-peptide cyclotransferase [Sorghum bicolor]
MCDGWGLVTDGKVLFGSDGTSTLYKLDPKSLEVMKVVTVKYHGDEVPYLNELEYIDGEVWANVGQGCGRPCMAARRPGMPPLLAEDWPGLEPPTLWKRRQETQDRRADAVVLDGFKDGRATRATSNVLATQDH